MKKLFTLSAIALMAMASLSGCSKKSSGISGYSMTASVGSTSYSAGYCVAQQSGTAATITGFANSGSEETPPYMQIVLGSSFNKTVGTYNFDSTLLNNTAIYYASATSIIYSKSGSITITAVSPKMTGTFNFVCTDGTVVSGGTFTAVSY